MPEELGLWLDYRKAVLVRLTSDDAIKVKHLHSRVEPQHRSTGGEGTARPFWHRSSYSKRRMLARKENEVWEFFKEVAKLLDKNHKLYIFGPGEAKLEFKNFLLKQDFPVEIITAVDNSLSHLTDTQIITSTRKHFDRLPPRLGEEG